MSRPRCPVGCCQPLPPWPKPGPGSSPRIGPAAQAGPGLCSPSHAQWLCAGRSTGTATGAQLACYCCRWEWGCAGTPVWQRHCGCMAGPMLPQHSGHRGNISATAKPCGGHWHPVAAPAGAYGTVPTPLHWGRWAIPSAVVNGLGTHPASWEDPDTTDQAKASMAHDVAVQHITGQWFGASRPLWGWAAARSPCRDFFHKERGACQGECPFPGGARPS